MMTTIPSDLSPAFAGQNATPTAAARYRLPTVTADASAGSYFRDCVHYPFPVHYAWISDERGRDWEIAYMDECPGDAQRRNEAATILLIHGRGVSSAYYGALMLDLLNAGYRVIIPDIPHYGKSAPGNLKLPLTRSLDDVRVLFRGLLNRLGVTRVAVLGHSLGGQIALGYALRYPEQVSQLILMASAGLEEFIPSPFFASELKDDMEAWQMVWGPERLVETDRARTPEQIRQAYFGRSGQWFFTFPGDYQEFIVQQRIGLISAPAQEFEKITSAMVRDVYSMAEENRQGDPDSLVKRTANLTMPVFLAAGGIDPFFPMQTLTGNTEVMADLIEPFRVRLADAGNAPMIKIYRGIGHYIHLDAAEEFSRDLRVFLSGQSPAEVLLLAW